MANKTAILSVKIVSDARRFSRSMKQASKAVDGFQKGVSKIGKIGAVTTALSLLSAGALAASSNLLALGASLVTVAGAGLALPGMLAGFGVGLGVMMLALKDAGTVLADLGPKFSALQDSISSNFWAVAADPIREMVNTLLPRLEGGLGRVATKLGGFFAELAGSLQGALTPGVLKEMFTPLISSIQTAKGAIQPLVQGFVTLGTVGGQYLQPLAEWFVKLSEQFNAFVQGAASDGRLKQWIDTGIAGLVALGSIVGSVVTIFYGLAKAAMAAGGAPIQALATGLQKIATAVNSPAFQGALTSLFKGAHSAISSLSGAIAGVSGNFATILPILGSVMALAGQLGAAIISVVVPAFTAIATAVQPVIAAIVGALAPALQKIGAWFKANQPAIAAFAASLGGMVAGAVSTLAPMISGLANTLMSMGSFILQNQEAFLALGAAILGGVTAFLVLKGAITAITVATAAFNAVMALNPIALVVIAVAALVAGIVYLATQTTFFQTIWTAMTAFVQSAISAVTSFFTSAWNSAQAVFAAVVSAIGNAWNAGMQFVQNVVQVAIAVAKAYIQTVVGVVSSVISAVQGFFEAGFNAAQAVVQAAISVAKSVIQTIVGVVSSVISSVQSFFTSGFNAAQSIVQSVISGIKSVIEGIRSTVSGVISYVKGIFVDGFNFMRSAAEGAINAVIGIIDGITGAVQNAIGWVRDLFSMDGMPGWLGDVLGMGGTGFEMVHNFGAPQAIGIGGTGALSFARYIGQPQTSREHEHKDVERVTEQIINVHPSAALDERKVGDAAARELMFRVNR